MAVKASANCCCASSMYKLSILPSISVYVLSPMHNKTISAVFACASVSLILITLVKLAPSLNRTVPEPPTLSLTA